MKELILHFLLVLLPLSLALEPGDIFPSCLKANMTWDQSGISHVFFNIPSPEACQEKCISDSSCAGVTWSTEDATPFSKTCFLFADISGSSIPCQNCVSGPGECACTLPGECEIQEDNLVDIMSGVEDVDECQALCRSSPSCTVFTFFGEQNHLRHTCFLYKSCQVFASDCTDCTTGFSQCDICDFESTMVDGSCAEPTPEPTTTTTPKPEPTTTPTTTTTTTPEPTTTTTPKPEPTTTPKPDFDGEPLLITSSRTVRWTGGTLPVTIQYAAMGGGGGHYLGGGGSGFLVCGEFTLDTDEVQVTIGHGGGDEEDGGDTKIRDDIIARGGKRGYDVGGDGWSGGGGGGSTRGGEGGYNGQDGPPGTGSDWHYPGGQGQGTSLPHVTLDEGNLAPGARGGRGGHSPCRVTGTPPTSARCWG